MLRDSWGHGKRFTNCAGRDELGSILLFTMDGYLQNVLSLGEHLIPSTIVKGCRLIFYRKFTHPFSTAAVKLVTSFCL